MSKKQKTSVRAKAGSTNSPHPITDKARKAALEEIGERIAALDSAESGAEKAASVHEGVQAQEPAAGEGRGRKPKGPGPAKEPKQKKAKPKAPQQTKPKRVSALDAAAEVLAASKAPMKAIDMIAEMEAKGLWKSKSGKTPEATLYAAIIREIAAKGRDARFKKHDRGLFVAPAHAKGAA